MLSVARGILWSLLFTGISVLAQESLLGTSVPRVTPDPRVLLTGSLLAPSSRRQEQRGQ